MIDCAAVKPKAYEQRRLDGCAPATARRISDSALWLIGYGIPHRMGRC